MICHVCQKPASGQCRDCLKFYCPQHGDGRCAPCARNPSTAPPGTEAVAPVFVVASKKCYECKEPALLKCGNCGKHFCPKHGLGVPGSTDMTFRCYDCQREVLAFDTAMYIFWLVIAVVIGLVIYFNVPNPARLNKRPG